MRANFLGITPTGEQGIKEQESPQLCAPDNAAVAIPIPADIPVVIPRSPRRPRDLLFALNVAPGSIGGFGLIPRVLAQAGVFGAGLSQHRNVRIGVFPQS